MQLYNVGSKFIFTHCFLPKLYLITFCNFSQVAFLSALAGVDIAEVAAQAAVTTLSEVENGAGKGSLGSLARNTRQEGMNSIVFLSSHYICLLEPIILFIYELNPISFLIVNK